MSLRIKTLAYINVVRNKAYFANIYKHLELWPIIIDDKYWCLTSKQLKLLFLFLYQQITKIFVLMCAQIKSIASN